MKKITGLALFCCLIFGLTSCAHAVKPASSSGFSPEQLLAELNKDKDVVFTDLSLTEGKDVTLSTQGVGMYPLKDRQSLFGEDFTLSFLIDQTPGKSELYAIDFTKEFSGDTANKNAYDTAKALMTKLNKAYGSPTAYEGLPNQLSALTDYKAKSQEEEYSEQWKVSDSAEAHLTLMLAPSSASYVIIEYRAPNDGVRLPISSSSQAS